VGSHKKAAPWAQTGARFDRVSASPESELLAAILERVDELAREMVEATRAEVPSFRGVPPSEQLADTRASIEWLARFALESPTPPPDLDRLERVGARRAGQGVPVEDLLQAWRISVRIGTDQARRIAAELNLDAQLVIDVFQGALRAADHALVPLAGGHRDARRRNRADPDRSRDRFVVAALTGELEPGRLRSEAASLGLDLTAPYRALRAIGSGPGEIPEVPAGGSGSADPLCTVHEGELIGLSRGPVERGTASLVAIGPEGPIDELAASFAAAGRILNAGRSLGLAGVHDIESAALFVTVFESGDAGDALIDRYVRPVAGAQSGADLLATVRTWQETGMRTEATAERLHIHPNTLRYRLQRYEELTGADLSETEELVAVWLAFSRDAVGGARLS
jgi:hypothetical protein